MPDLTLEQELAALFITHGTDYHQDPHTGKWIWTCKCGQRDVLDDWDTCHHETRHHWTYFIVGIIAREVTAGRQKAYTDCLVMARDAEKNKFDVSALREAMENVMRHECARAAQKEH